MKTNARAGSDIPKALGYQRGKEDTLRTPTIVYESFSQETSIYWFTQINFIWYQNSELMSTLNANLSELLKETANLQVISEWVSDLEQDFCNNKIINNKVLECDRKSAIWL